MNMRFDCSCATLHARDTCVYKLENPSFFNSCRSMHDFGSLVLTYRQLVRRCFWVNTHEFNLICVCVFTGELLLWRILLAWRCKYSVAQNVHHISSVLGKVNGDELAVCAKRQRVKRYFWSSKPTFDISSYVFKHSWYESETFFQSISRRTIERCTCILKLVYKG